MNCRCSLLLAFYCLGVLATCAQITHAQSAYPPAPTTTTRSVDDLGIVTYSFREAKPTGTFAVLGRPFVVAEDGPVVITGHDLPNKSGGRTLNGMQVNPGNARRYHQADHPGADWTDLKTLQKLNSRAGPTGSEPNGFQGYDSNADGKDQPAYPLYRNSLNQNPAISGSDIELTEGTVITGVSKNNNNGALRRFSWLTVLPKAPPADAFMPGCASAAKRIYRTSEVDMSKLPRVTIPAGSPAAEGDFALYESILLGMCDWTWQSIYQVNTRALWPTDHPAYTKRPGKPGLNAYGSNFSEAVSLALWWAMAGEGTDSERRRIVELLVQLGIIIADRVEQGGIFEDNGGHPMGRALPVAVAATFLDCGRMRRILRFTIQDMAFHRGGSAPEVHPGKGESVFADFAQFQRLSDNAVAASQAIHTNVSKDNPLTNAHKGRSWWYSDMNRDGSWHGGRTRGVPENFLGNDHTTNPDAYYKKQRLAYGTYPVLFHTFPDLVNSMDPDGVDRLLEFLDQMMRFEIEGKFIEGPARDMSKDKNEKIRSYAKAWYSSMIPTGSKWSPTQTHPKRPFTRQVFGASDRFVVEPSAYGPMVDRTGSPANGLLLGRAEAPYGYILDDGTTHSYDPHTTITKAAGSPDRWVFKRLKNARVMTSVLAGTATVTSDHGRSGTMVGQAVDYTPAGFLITDVGTATDGGGSSPEAPEISNRNPALDGSAYRNINISVTWDRKIKLADGVIKIVRTDTDEELARYDPVSTAPEVRLSTDRTRLFINPSTDLPKGAPVEVRVSRSAIVSDDGTQIAESDKLLTRFTVRGGGSSAATARTVNGRATDLMLYPNPSAGTFTLVLPETEKTGQVSVLDLSGKVVYQAPTDGKRALSIATTLPTGSYLVKVVGVNASYVERLVVE